MQSPPDLLSAVSVVRRYYGVWLVYSLAGGFLAGVYPLSCARAATAGGSMGLLLGGYVADLRGIPFAWKMAGTLSLLAVPCYLAQRPRPDLAAPRRPLP